MIKHLRITVLADNCAQTPDLLAELGLSMLIEADGHRILFDTGQGRVLRANAQALGVSLGNLDAIVLSHGHFDHTGGLAAILEEKSAAPIFVHPSALDEKYAKSDQPPHRSIGLPEEARFALDTSRDRIIWTRSPTEVAPGVWCTGKIPRVLPFGEQPNRFFLDPDCTQPDPISDDQALFVRMQQGLVVAVGCAHAGVVNTLDYVAQLCGQDSIFAVIGGFHLGRVPHEVWEAVGDALAKRDVQVIAPCHCTGAGAQAYLRGRFHSRVFDAGAGSHFVLGAE
jgi:7,8-dihydropterin-6-yl-methyl-4-(beta-D-ribofuranosyl)aminobenzene 5'-phosphate synthase